MADAGIIAMEVGSDVLKSSAKTINELVEAILKAIASRNNNSLTDALNEHLKNGKQLECFIDNKIGAKVIEDKLNDLNVPYAKFYSNAKGNARTYFITRDIDRNKITQGLDKACSEQSFIPIESIEDLPFANGVNGKTPVVTVDNIDKNKLIFLNEFAKKNSINFVLADTENNKSKIIFKQSDLNNAKKCIANMSVYYSGATGKLYEEIRNRDILNSEQAFNKARKTKETFYIMSGDNAKDYIKATPDTCEHVKNNEIIRSSEKLSREGSGFAKYEAILNLRIHEIAHPILITEEEFNMHKTDMQSFINNKKNETITTTINSNINHIEQITKELFLAKLENNNYDKSCMNTDKDFTGFQDFFKEEIEADTIEAKRLKELAVELDSASPSMQNISINCMSDVFDNEELYDFSYEELSKESLYEKDIDNLIRDNDRTDERTLPSENNEREFY